MPSNMVRRQYWSHYEKGKTIRTFKKERKKKNGFVKFISVEKRSDAAENTDKGLGQIKNDFRENLT